MISLLYKVQTKYHWQECTSLDEMRQWLRDQIGEPYSHWQTGVYDSDFVYVRFKNEQDAMLFSLRFL